VTYALARDREKIKQRPSTAALETYALVRDREAIQTAAIDGRAVEQKHGF